MKLNELKFGSLFSVDFYYELRPYGKQLCIVKNHSFTCLKFNMENISYDIGFFICYPLILKKMIAVRDNQLVEVF